MNYIAHVRVLLVVCVSGSFYDVVVNSVYTVGRVQIDKEHLCNSVLFQKAASHCAHTVDKHNPSPSPFRPTVKCNYRKISGDYFPKIKWNYVITVDHQQEYIHKKHNEFSMSVLSSSRSQRSKWEIQLFC